MTAHLSKRTRRSPHIQSRWGDISTSQVIGRGDVRLTLLNNGVPTPAKLRDVLHVPPFAYSLVSVSCLAASGVDVQFNEDSAPQSEE